MYPRTLRVSYLLISCFIAQMAHAECPAGKSEVIVVTPSGNSKNICIAQQALPAIENAANGEVIQLAATCPCEGVWTGQYTDETLVAGEPPILPDPVTDVVYCRVGNHADYTQVVLLTQDPATSIYTAYVAKTESYPGDSCIAGWPAGSITNYAVTRAAEGTVFTQEIIGNGVVDDPRLEACRQFLEDRGCNFIE